MRRWYVEGELLLMGCFGILCEAIPAANSAG